MLSLVMDRVNPNSFASLVVQLSPSLRNQVRSFTLDSSLSRVEDEDSLYNLALLKLWEAVQNFEYDPLLSEKHNELRFLKMVRLYVKNEMIDHQYAANVEKRKPKEKILSMNTVVVRGEEGCEDEIGNDVPSTCPTVLQVLEAREFEQFVLGRLKGDEILVFRLLSQGYPVETIAGKLGIQISRVRYIVYEKIHPRARRYA